MRKYWSHAAMLLLGISLTVGLYEGRRLVKNTAKALTAATSMTASAGKRGRDHDRAAEDDEEDDGAGVASVEEEEHERKRRRPRSAPVTERELDKIPRMDKVNLLRQRTRQRVEHNGESAFPTGQSAFPTGRSAVPPVAIPMRPEGDAKPVFDDRAAEDTAVEK